MKTSEEKRLNNIKRNKKYRETHKEKIRERDRKYRKENPERIKIINKRSRDKNREKTREIYRIKHHSKTKEEITLLKEENEKEIIETRAYIKKVWGKNIPMLHMAHWEIKELGNELGIDVFHLKKFGRLKKKLRIYTRVCPICDKFFKIKREDGIRPHSKYNCPKCKKKITKKGKQNQMDKNTKAWWNKVSEILKKNENGMSVSHIARELGSSPSWVSNLICRFKKQGKINFFYKGKMRYFKIVTTKG